MWSQQITELVQTWADLWSQGMQRLEIRSQFGLEGQSEVFLCRGQRVNTG